MAAKYLRKNTWWIRFYHPRTGALMRASLETQDVARAELLRQRVELEAALLDPRFQAANIPPGIRALVGGRRVSNPPPEPAAETIPPSAPTVCAAAKPRTGIATALKAYLDFIRIENAPHHVAGKLSMMRRFFGSDRVEALLGRRSPATIGKKPAAVVPAFFTGGFVDEITPALVQGFMEQMEVSKKTKRHYREFFHHFFEFCMKFDFYQPTNWHRPNPIAALPSYMSRNRRIVFLTPAQVDEQLHALKDVPRVQIAVAIMIYAGLRRAETMWLTRDAISKDLSYLSIVNRVDDDRDVESSLKTGDRAVTILPPLKTLLESYLVRVRGKWLIPSSKGAQWGGNEFAKNLRALNRAAGLTWTCLHYRHTYATQRAADGWPLFRIAREMGNSVSVVEEYYAGFIRPDSEASAA
jgi:integrase